MKSIRIEAWASVGLAALIIVAALTPSGRAQIADVYRSAHGVATGSR